ncbi:MAG: hypothetical protein AABY22_31015 [Nanoarchaeota archaeon]
MKLTYQQIDELNAAYLNLTFKEGGVMNAAENINKLKPLLDTILTCKSQLIKKYNKGQETISADHPKWRDFLDEFNKNLLKEADVSELNKIKKTDIYLQNIPQGDGQKTNPQGFIAVLLARGLLE